MESGQSRTSPDNSLFEACFRIQREASEAAGHYIPMVVENVRGAQKWVGRSRWNYGSYHLWGDVPALMPMSKAIKNNGGSWFKQAHNTTSGCGQNPDGRKVPGLDWSRYGKPGYKAQGFNTVADQRLREQEGITQGGDWFSDPAAHSRMFSSKSNGRKRAAAMIAKIPLVLSRYIAATYKPRMLREG